MPTKKQLAEVRRTVRNLADSWAVDYGLEPDRTTITVQENIPSREGRTVVTTQGVVIHYPRVRVAENEFEALLTKPVDSTKPGTVADIIDILPKPGNTEIKDGTLETYTRLKELGMTAAAQTLDSKIKERTLAQKGYRKISIDKIVQFLTRKVEIYNTERGSKNPANIENAYRIHRSIAALTCDYVKGVGIGRFVWQETPIEKYAGIPPMRVLDALAKAKPDFDEIVVAEVKNLPDPILLGRFKEELEGYYSPDSQWGQDVSLDDLF